MSAKPVLVDNIDLFRAGLAAVNDRAAFIIMAWVVLPDHFHMVIDPKQHDISNLLQRIKMSFGALWRKRRNVTSGRVWQNRFWDHIIRDQTDLNRHIDYVHFNPVRHKYVDSPFEWQYSSIHDYYREGFYSRDWGKLDEVKIQGEFGE
ncbi:MAG: transposase [candidate division Zixibacteria bacterium]|nr:transposase [candidate division Zixibacteria bacterium]